MTKPTPPEDGNPPPATTADLAPAAMQDIRHLLFEQGKRLQNVLEVQGKQNTEFQHTLTGITRTMANRTQGGDKDPHFPGWDGNRATPLLWLHQADEIRKARQMPENTAIRFARHAMGVGAYAISRKSRLPPARTLSTS